MLDGIGQTIVVALGGEAKGIESWNPSDGFSKVLSNETPSEVGSTFGLKYASLVTINNGQDVLICGGMSSVLVRNKIWKYNLVSDKKIKLFIAKTRHFTKKIFKSKNGLVFALFVGNCLFF